MSEANINKIARRIEESVSDAAKSEALIADAKIHFENPDGIDARDLRLAYNRANLRSEYAAKSRQAAKETKEKIDLMRHQTAVVQLEAIQSEKGIIVEADTSLSDINALLPPGYHIHHEGILPKSANMRVRVAQGKDGKPVLFINDKETATARVEWGTATGFQKYGERIEKLKEKYGIPKPTAHIAESSAAPDATATDLSSVTRDQATHRGPTLSPDAVPVATPKPVSPVGALWRSKGVAPAQEPMADVSLPAPSADPKDRTPTETASVFTPLPTRKPSNSEEIARDKIVNETIEFIAKNPDKFADIQKRLDKINPSWDKLSDQQKIAIVDSLESVAIDINTVDPLLRNGSKKFSVAPDTKNILSLGSREQPRTFATFVQVTLSGDQAHKTMEMGRDLHPGDQNASLDPQGKVLRMRVRSSDSIFFGEYDNDTQSNSILAKKEHESEMYELAIIPLSYYEIGSLSPEDRLTYVRARFIWQDPKLFVLRDTLFSISPDTGRITPNPEKFFEVRHLGGWSTEKREISPQTQELFNPENLQNIRIVKDQVEQRYITVEFIKKDGQTELRSLFLKPDSMEAVPAPAQHGTPFTISTPQPSPARTSQSTEAPAENSTSLDTVVDGLAAWLEQNPLSSTPPNLQVPATKSTYRLEDMWRRVAVGDKNKFEQDEQGTFLPKVEAFHVREGEKFRELNVTDFKKFHDARQLALFLRPMKNGEYTVLFDALPPSPRTFITLAPKIALPTLADASKVAAPLGPDADIKLLLQSLGKDIDKVLDVREGKLFSKLYSEAYILNPTFVNQNGLLKDTPRLDLTLTSFDVAAFDKLDTATISVPKSELADSQPIVRMNVGRGSPMRNDVMYLIRTKDPLKTYAVFLPSQPKQ